MGKIYTRKGDDGTTGLFDGTRVQKDHLRCEAYGGIDELSAALGVARAFAAEKEIADEILVIQKDLLALGAQLADPAYGTRPAKAKTVITEERVVAFEKMMDRWTAELPPLKGFILRGGSPGAAFLHLACAVCRRAERSIVALGRQVELPPLVVRYVNRLSDLLFTLARAENRRAGEAQIDW